MADSKDMVRVNADDIQHYGVDSVFELWESVPKDNRLLPVMMASLRSRLAEACKDPFFIKLELPRAVERSGYLPGPERARLVMAVGIVGSEEMGDRRLARVIRVDCSFVPTDKLMEVA